MFEVLDGDADWFTEHDTEAVLAIIRRHDVVVLGPGLGVKPETEAFVHNVLDGLSGTSTALVLDADALNLIANRGKPIARHDAVLTPHPGEAARLLGMTPAEVQRDRFSAARMLAQRYAVPVVLKGAGTLVHNGSSGRLVADGTPYLATPGSGDVLSGITAACIARSESVYDAASLGAWIHARAGARAAEIAGGTIIASDIAGALGAYSR
jgi:NAD(P)H-hydrate epimerase